jgi:RNA polymerase sigma-B factor
LRERIILAYLGLADRLAGRYVRSQGVTLDDMRQAARVGLITAVDRYDPTRGTSFVPYAVACVRGELKRYLRDTTWTLRIARPLKERSLAVCRALDELPSRLGRQPTIAEVAEHLDACPQEVVEAIGAAGPDLSSPWINPSSPTVRPLLVSCWRTRARGRSSRICWSSVSWSTSCPSGSGG